MLKKENFFRYSGFLLMIIIALSNIENLWKNGSFYKKIIIWERIIFFTFLAFFYIIRPAPKSTAKGFWENIFPLLVPFIPVFLTFANPIEKKSFHISYFVLGILGMGITLLGLISLNTAFSLRVECRKLVTTGIYRWIRHPLYLGQSMLVLGMAITRFSILSITIFCIFMICIIKRLKLEEKKLSETFPEYIEYKKTNYCILPGIL